MDFLNTVSPLSGMISGKGLMGELAAKGAMGLLPRAIAKDAYADEEEKRKKQAAGAPMKKGGKVSSASSRADGCAVKGKTRGKMV